MKEEKLMKAALTGDSDALREALAAGSDVHAVDADGWTSLMLSKTAHNIRVRKTEFS